MPKGVYRKKNKKGRMMHFRDGKLISKRSYDASKARTKGTRKGQVRKTARRAFTPKRKKGSNKMAKRASMPHPSLTGLASGALVFSWLNSKSGWTGRTEGKESVINWLAQGNLNKASMRFIENSKSLFKPKQGLPVVTSAIALAVGGSIARKHFKGVKIGGKKIYATL